MPDIVFRNVSVALFTYVRHGQERIIGKLDSGAPITVFNLAAMSLLTGSDEETLRGQIIKSRTPHAPFNGYNGIASELYLCILHNMILGTYNFRSMYVGVSLDYPIGKDGKPISKILLGMDIINSCTGKLNEGNLELNVKNDDAQRKRMLEAFEWQDESAILVIDEVS